MSDAVKRRNEERSHEKNIRVDSRYAVITCPFCHKPASHLIADLEKQVQRCDCGAVHNHLGKSQKAIEVK